MRDLTVIIPSRTMLNLELCLEYVREHEPRLRIIVVDDFDHNDICSDGSDLQLYQLRTLAAKHHPCQIIAGVKPFVFARNVNIGIQAAGDDDVVILNDDALLESYSGFTAMQQFAQDPRVGLISASTNLAGNPAQMRSGGEAPLQVSPRECPSPTPGNSFATVAYICVLIPRHTIQKVGLFDERFGGTTPEGKRFYGYEDNDYSRRIAGQGMKIGIYDGCFVDHSGKTIKSTYRSEPFDMEAARQVYLAKWGKM